MYIMKRRGFLYRGTLREQQLVTAAAVYLYQGTRTATGVVAVLTGSYDHPHSSSNSLLLERASCR